MIEDDRIIGEAVRDHVVAASHAVDWVQCLADADAVAGAVPYGLILLDLQLPDGNGVTFLGNLRARGDHTPVIILTARDQVSDRIAGLNAGADDYLVKPFNLGELEARIFAVTRRYEGKPQAVVHIGDLEIDRASHRIAVAGEAVSLTHREWAVLDLLIARPGTIVTKGSIEEALYAFGAEVESNTVEVYVSRLRKKIGRDRITTARGLGYRLENA